MNLPTSSDYPLILHGDCVEEMRQLPEASVHAVVTDPPYGINFMGKAWDAPGGMLGQMATGYADNDNAAFGAWCETWLTECLRVLKPGGHLLAFGGTRTWHRLACAVEDAGFEIRDSIAWLYGSGFPKSLDVSKAIDKAQGATGTYGEPKSAAHAGWIDRGRMRGDEGEEGWQRPWMQDEGAVSNAARRYLPGSTEAQAFAGWGTALKPSFEGIVCATKPSRAAFEPVVVARKPLASPGVNVLSVVESGLRERGVEGAIQWTSGPVSGAARLDPLTSSSSTGAPPAGGTSAAPAAASETLSAAKPTASNSGTITPHGAKPTANTSAPTPDARRQNSAPKSSPPMATPAPAVGSEHPTSSRSTTSTEAAPLTARRHGERSTTRSSASDSQTAIESFAGIATGLTGSWATVRIDRLADGTCVWPDGLPRNTAGGSTVAANVLAHGTGALNIDGCRIEHGGNIANADGGGQGAGYEAHNKPARIYGKGLGGIVAEPHTSGRWPANVVLDESQAGALDEQSGTQRDGVAVKRNGRTEAAEGWGNIGKAAVITPDETYGDRGGASRFFYVAKADASERPRLPKRSLRLRDDLTPEQVDHVRARLVEAGVQVD